MTLIARQDASGLGGKEISFQTSTAADTIVGGQCVHLLINNTSGSTQTCTITTPETVEGTLAVAERVITGILTAKIWEIPIPSRYNDPITGVATVAVSGFGATMALAAVQTTPQP